MFFKLFTMFLGHPVISWHCVNTTKVARKQLIAIHN